MVASIYFLVSLLLVINPNTGKPTGSVNMWGKVVLNYWKNLYVGHNKAANVTQQQTLFQATVKAKMVEFANRYRSDLLTVAQRQGWDSYAASLYQPPSEGQSMYVIPRRNKIMSGINAYTQTNITEFLADGTGPDDEAPLGDSTPPPFWEALAVIGLGVVWYAFFFFLLSRFISIRLTFRQVLLATALAFTLLLIVVLYGRSANS